MTADFFCNCLDQMKNAFGVDNVIILFENETLR